VYGGTPDLAIQSIYENSNSVTQELRLSGEGGIFKYVLGGYYFRESHIADNRAPFNLLLFGGPDQFVQFYNAGGQETTNAYAGFGQVDIKPVSKLTLSVGLRYSYEKKHLHEFVSVDTATPYDNTRPIEPLFFPAGAFTQFQDASYSSFDPRFTLSYQFNPRVIGYATYSQGFKSGGFNIGGAQPAFAPERIKDYEVGLKGDFLHGHLRTNVSAFYYDYTNLQVNQTKGFSEQTVNAASAKVKGVEAEVTALLATRLRVSLNAAWLDATYTKFDTEDPAREALGTLHLQGNRLNYAPKYKVGGTVAYTIPSPYGNFTPTADVIWTDRVYFTPYNTARLSQAAHTNIDLSIHWVGNNSDWTGSIFVRNLTNKIYITGAGVNNPILNFNRNGQVSAPRTYGIQLTRHF
jgi:iron complex outermembrane receptor protein